MVDYVVIVFVVLVSCPNNSCFGVRYEDCSLIEIFLDYHHFILFMLSVEAKYCKQILFLMRANEVMKLVLVYDDMLP